MNILSRYLVREVVRPMLAIVLVALAAMLAERMLRVVDIVVGWRGSVLILIEMLGYLVPHYMGMALPAAFFIAILLVVSRLSRDGELDAMIASGQNLFQILRPLFAVALALVAINTIVLSHLQPYSRYAYRAALFTLANVSFQALLRAGQFVTLEGTTYLVEELSAERDQFEGLLLFSTRLNGDTLALTAIRGRIVPGQGNAPITLDLEDGIQQYLPATPKAGETAAISQSATVRFRDFSSDLRGGEPKPFRPRGEDERELTLPELWDGLDRPVSGIARSGIAAEFHGRIVRIISTVILPLIAVPLAVARRRAQRSYGFVIGIGILLLMNQSVQFGESLTDDGKISPWLGLWVPFLLFSILGAFLTWQKSERVPAGTASSWLDATIERLQLRLQRRWAAGSAP